MIKNILFTVFFLAFLTAFGQDSIQNNVKKDIKFTGSFQIEELNQRFIKQNKGAKIDGYRIQLYSGNREEATSRRKAFVNAFPEIVSELVYETPDYKVQATDCTTQLEAEKYLAQIREVFPGAFVVKSKIALPDYSKNRPQPVLLIDSTSTDTIKKEPLK